MAEGDRERWNAKWTDAGTGTSHGSKLVDLLEPWLPPTGRLLDIAGGGSSDSLAFARRGLEVTVADVSDVGLRRAREAAAAEGLTIMTTQVDFEADELPAGPWDVITVANYLQRDLFTRLADHLASNGLLAVVIATTANLERHDKPGERFLLSPGEVLRLVEGLEVLQYSEEWRVNGRHEAHIVVRCQ